MIDPVDFLAGAVTIVFTAGATYGALRSQIRAARIEASTATAALQEVLGRVAEEKNRSTKQDGKLDLYNERIGNLRRDVDEMRAAFWKSRVGSEREMPAARPPHVDERREPSDPVPPQRPRAPSYRRE